MSQTTEPAESTIPAVALPDSAARLVAHLVEDHGWGEQGYDASMRVAHRIAHGDMGEDLDDSRLTHSHTFPTTQSGPLTGKLVLLLVVLPVVVTVLAVLAGLK